MINYRENFRHIAKIAIETSVYHVDREFCYAIPPELTGRVLPGCKVWVPFGRGNRKVRAIVLTLEQSPLPDGIKQITALIDEQPVLSDELLKLVVWMKQKYYCTVFDAVKVVMPSTASNCEEKQIKMLRLKDQFQLPDLKLTKKQQEVYNILKNKGSLLLKEVCYFTGVTAAVVANLVKNGVCEWHFIKAQKTLAKPQPPQEIPEEIKLTDEQQRAFDKLSQSKGGEVSLLYGVTGSGKTSVFMKLIEKVHLQGRGVIVMVPEIALTPQMTSIFYARFGSTVAVFHSNLSAQERHSQWQRVKDEDAKIVVGTRSSVFMPFKDIGLIILDEEQENSYKSESTPRYHAKEIAEFRCKYHGGLLLLSSATPSIESFYYAQTGHYNFSELSKRYADAKLPQVSIVDMGAEASRGNVGIFSSQLLNSLKENIKAKMQSILLLNRRGCNTFVACHACKKVVDCPNCSISMIYHSANNRLMCHYCGYSMNCHQHCLHCGEKQICYSGVGTQKVEQELKELMPNARILRMDADTTIQKSAYVKNLSAFANYEYDILIGTQMIAKGLDFERVTLVGALSTDSFLYGSDFRSYEKAFSLLTQVVGRSGRRSKPGKAIIQTLTPENPIISLAAKQDYKEFYNTEIQLRKLMLYPPFTSICVIGFTGPADEKTRAAANNFCNMLVDQAKKNRNLPIRILGPSAALILKLNNKYRYKIIIKHKSSKDFKDMIATLKIEFAQHSSHKHINMFIDSNPVSIF